MSGGEVPFLDKDGLPVAYVCLRTGSTLGNRTFPIQTCGIAGAPRHIPWDVIAPHEAQAVLNHGGQTLERLAERCGLSPCEAVAVLEDRRWHRMDPVESVRRLIELVTQKGGGR